MSTAIGIGLLLLVVLAGAFVLLLRHNLDVEEQSSEPKGYTKRTDPEPYWYLPCDLPPCPQDGGSPQESGCH